jgi:peroxiredoxin
MDQLFSGRVSVVVFLRSLGWPLCQEHLLQYSRKREDLLANGIDLIMISIGKPEVGKKLIAHLELQDGEKYIFVGKYMPVHISFLCCYAFDNVPP